MKSIKLRVWIAWALALFALGVMTDYYFLHILFHRKQQEIERISEETDTVSAASPNSGMGSDDSFLGENAAVKELEIAAKDNFTPMLQACAPEVAAQAIGTPEALMEYLQKSVGAAKEEISIENYHLTLADGSKRRIHLVTSDNTNAKDRVEIRFFRLDAEGYPERLTLKGDETLESLLALGQVTNHEVKSRLELKDGTAVNLEKHDNVVFEFQYFNGAKTLSCRYKECVCQ